MKNNISNVKKNKKNMLLTIFTFFILFCSIFNFMIQINILATASSYIPAPPSGDESGFENVEYTYIILTENIGSSWMFDWDDGSYSEWIKLGESEDSISQTHIWSLDGIYEVKVKRNDIYQGESPWSDPLIVKISIPPDIDNDGWENELEESYGTNVTDSNDHPIDTDGDGTPDDSSSDGKYAGDANDDNDALSDAVEETLNSDSKNSLDVLDVTISDDTYYFVKTKNNGFFDKFYNNESKKNTSLGLDDGLYLIDLDGDGKYDYTYHLIYGLSLYEGEKTFEFPLMFLVLTIVLVVLLIVFVLFKKGIFYVYEEEYVEEVVKKDKNTKKK